MLLPSGFTEAIADAFYDKTVSILSKSTTNTDGWVEEMATTVTSTFKGNVRFSNLGEVQSEIGLSEKVDVVVSCAITVAISVDDLFGYDGVTYKALAVVPSDSHLEIVGSKWA